MKTRPTLSRCAGVLLAAILASLAAPASAAVVFTKNCVDQNGGQVCAGDVIRCTLHVEVNGGGQEIFVITDLIRSSFFTTWNAVATPPSPPATNSSMREGQSLPPNGRYQWNNVIMNPGSSFDFIYDAVVGNLAFGTQVCPTAILSDQNLDDWSAQFCHQYTCVPPNTPNTQLSKEWQSATPVVPGTPISFVLVLTNTGGTAADSNVRVTDTLDPAEFAPPTVTYSPPTRTPTSGGLVGNTLDATWSTLAIGETITITLNTVYANCVRQPGLYTACNQAMLQSTAITTPRGSDNPLTTPFGDSTCKLTVPGLPGLIAVPVVKTMTDVNGGQLLVGDVMHVRVSFQNTSACPTDPGRFEDPIPADVTYVAGSTVVTPASGVSSYDAVTRTVIVDNLTVPGATTTTVEFDVTVASVPPSGQICNTGRYRFETSSFIDTTQACLGLPPVPDTITASKANTATGGTIAPGDTFDYRISVTNTGTNAIADATVVDTVPSCYTIVSAAGGTFVGQVVTFSNVSLPAGGPATVLTIRVRENGTCPLGPDPCNRATASTPRTSAPVTTNDSCLTISTLPPTCPTLPVHIAPLQVKKSGSDVVFSWPIEASSANGYRVYSVLLKRDLPANGLNGLASLECSATVGVLTCTDVGGIPGPPNGLFYSVVGVCANGVEGAD